MAPVSEAGTCRFDSCLERKMPDDFGELEQEVMERIQEENARQQRVIREAFVGIPEPPAPGTVVRVHDVFNDAFNAPTRRQTVISPPGGAIRIAQIELTEAEREGLTIRDGVRIPPDDRIGLVDPADGTLKMYSRAEIRAKVKPRPPGVSYDDANGYAGTFERPLRQEVVTVARSRKFSTWVVGLAASIGFVHALLYWISR